MNTEQQAIKDFVRKTLGCQCPEEVFDEIAVTDMTMTGEKTAVFKRIVIGGRLLVYIAELLAGEEGFREIEFLTRAGILDRDQNNYNRFRSVIVTSDAQATQEKVEEKFLRIVGEDDKAHVHVMDSMPF